MKQTRPDIPKRLAARIRGAQARVTDQRNYLAGTYRSLHGARTELEEFRSNPQAYAAERYPGHGVDSYPVQTRTSRLAEAVERRSGRIPDIEHNLKAAEAELACVEAEVLAEVARIRPTSGRVPWPKPLPSFERVIDREIAAEQRELDAQPVRRAAYRVALDASLQREQAALMEQCRREDEAEARRLARLTPAQREAERAEVRAFFDGLKARGLTVRDLFGVRTERSGD